MSIAMVEQGFQTVIRGLRDGKFTEQQLKFIVSMSDAISRDTNKLLTSIPVKPQKDSGAEDVINSPFQRSSE